ncbi:hypothetical protein SC08_Contig83orf01647 [Clostridium butyricum]|mgnify:FL=1|jgi:hypothetical protein|nr:hypothetical protein SC08_Contig83orf01647 [Clostridium butyricum]DAL62054.1 MAG TPA_asm: tRNA synthetase B5 domain [Caudoviricetes sp.]
MNISSEALRGNLSVIFMFKIPSDWRNEVIHERDIRENR